MISLSVKKLRLALSLLICLTASSCSADELKKLSVTYVASPLNVPSILEKRLGLIDKAFPDTEVRFPELNAGPDQTAAMAAGEVDIAHCVGGASVILAASEGLDIKIVGIYSRAPEAFMIVAKDASIRSIQDLKGKKIAGPKGTILHQLLVAALAEASLSASDVEFVNMGIPAAAAALESGRVDAALLAGAQAYRATSAGAVVVTNGVGRVDATTVIAMSGAFWTDRRADAVRFLQLHKDTVAHVKAHEDESVRLTAEETGLDPADVLAMYHWYDFAPEIRSSDIEELARTQEFMIENGLQRNRIEIESIIAK